MKGMYKQGWSTILPTNNKTNNHLSP